ncbi:BatD family protein [Marinicella rhabdoformis]|uniref:BatD family protein n=1 Tax=Marinicella rhabdoformis TaxID=2580566 RepID=UPI0012AEBD33|nr:BatD family protein [Marinicella rhabdoformis]
MNKYKLMIVLLLFSAVSTAELTATVDRTTLFLGESITLEVTMDKNTNGQPDFTMLDAVFHVGSTGRSSSTQIINGEASSTTTWQVLLVPKSLGSHIIPPIEVDGESTQALRIEVKKPDPNAKAQGDIFIEVIPNKTEAFVQEEIILTVRLLYAINLKNGGLSDPNADGVVVQQINKGASYSTQRDGKTYQVLERKYAIYAEHSGPLTLNPMVFEGEVTDNSRRSSYSMFQRGRPVRQVSEMLELNIKPIPQEFVNKPWIPASDLNVTQTWSQGDYKVGEPITRTINFVATGLSETQLPEVEIDQFKGAKIYQDKTDTMTRTDGERLIATKTIKYAVIPNEAGQLVIPAFKLDWFDTQNQTTQTALIPSTTFEVAAAEVATQNTPTPTAQIQTERPDSQVMIAAPTESQQITSNRDSIWRPLALIFASLWVLTALFLLRRMRKQGEQKTSEKPKKNTFDVNLRALKEATPSRIQQTLLMWWNQEHQQNVTNLSQIINQIDDKATTQAIESLQECLYKGAEYDHNISWFQLAKQGGFELKVKKQNKSEGLPELY